MQQIHCRKCGNTTTLAKCETQENPHYPTQSEIKEYYSCPRCQVLLAVLKTKGPQECRQGIFISATALSVALPIEY